MIRARPPAEPPHTHTRERGVASSSSSAGEAGQLRGTAGGVSWMFVFIQITVPGLDPACCAAVCGPNWLIVA